MASEINYRDAVLERADLALFAPPHWLNDRAIHFAMKLLEDDSAVKWLLLDPAVYAFLMLQCEFEDEDEVSDLRRGLVFPGDERVLVTVVSDAAGLHVGGGSHWSLLVYDVDADLARHYDSMGRSANEQRARQCAERLRVCFERETVTFEAIDTPRQTNAYDCGAYALAVCRALMMKGDIGFVTPATVEALREGFGARARAMFREAS
ncbi:unnamed protein product [Pelagomonas calceolata]|uniref:Ubiquitin-like protease family profile domain-containing protein n=1 Tax=Pelagomonas calceolata TaxID=35677 RepID=A0A7S4A0J1_9STRA|nr:unnamed protein product [Pelagomonas calceolata]|mmetsp:Transcript_2829/g.8505  ORF Transcript_2829/g.8505 Transcript_2829/m.8505 type:complete len:207 (+) Transcript_2829:391-1011(+)